MKKRLHTLPAEYPGSKNMPEDLGFQGNCESYTNGVLQVNRLSQNVFVRADQTYFWSLPSQ